MNHNILLSKLYHYGIRGTPHRWFICYLNNRIQYVYEWLCGRVPDLQSGGCGFASQPGLLRTEVYSAFHPSGVGKWVPAAAGKAKAGMAHSDCGWTCGCAGKTLENTCHTWTLLWWCFTTKRRYIKCLHLYLYSIWLSVRHVEFPQGSILGPCSSCYTLMTWIPFPYQIFLLL